VRKVAPRSVSATRRELGVIGQHARVIVSGQLATMAFGVTDAVIAGRYANEALATLAVASGIFVSIYVSLMSVLQALMPIYAELHGAKQPRKLGRALRQSLYLGGALVIIGMSLMMMAGHFLVWFDVPHELRPTAQSYLEILAWSLIPALGFRMFSALTQSLGAPRIVMTLQMISLVMKVPLTIWFVFGGLNLPAMGVVGCAWATLIVQSILLLLAWIAVKTMPIYQPLQLFSHIERPDLQCLKSYAVLGIPAGLASMVEVTSYALMGLLVARMGILATASHQIAASVAAVLFMFPLSLSIASSARVSYWMGAGDRMLAASLARSAVKLTVIVAITASLTLVILAVPVARLYSGDVEVASLGASLLIFVAIYHVADAWQTIGCFLLPCWRITVMPFFVYLATLWALGLGGGYLLAYGELPWVDAWNRPHAFWFMGFVALCAAAYAFQWRIWRLTRPT